MIPKSSDVELAEELSRYYDDPLGYVLFNFPWETNSAIQMVRFAEPTSDEQMRLRAKHYPSPEEYRQIYNWECEWGPDLWACDFLWDLGLAIKDRNFDGRNAVEPIQFATASGHGIGKSALSAWLVKFILDTRPYSKGTVTATTAEQLRTKTWAQLGFWHKLSLTEHWFKWTTGRGSMGLYHKKHSESWFCAAYTAREENSESFAGQHAANSTPFYLFDEASGVPDKIYEVREGGTTDGEPMVFDFGNPTRNSGRFYEECQGRHKSAFNVRQIDSRHVQITNKKRLNQWMDLYGEDSDFFKVRVRGVFPSTGATQFIATDLVLEAMAREVFIDRFDPMIIGVDVARFGDDDSVIYTRVGNDCRSLPVIRRQGLDTVQLTGVITALISRYRAAGFEPSAIFVDGGGVGGGVVDQLRALGYVVHEVQFGSKPIDSPTYRYKADEMWGRLRDALPRLSLPKDEGDGSVGRDLRDELTQREFGYTLSGNKIHLETKKDMKARGIRSPDIADALALTFAMDVPRLANPHGTQQSAPVAESEYDPYDGKDR